MKICKIEKKREVVDVDYEVCGDDYCCNKMRQWLRIGARSRNHLRCSIDTGRFEIEVREGNNSYGYDYDYDDSYDKAAYEDLDFCPFCGMRLQETVVIKKPKKKKWGRKK